MNPALDITTSAQRVGPPTKSVVMASDTTPAGGGINVARIARTLGAPVSAVFPAGGPTGDVLADLLTDSGVPFHRVKIGGRTRESFTVYEQSTGQQYRFVLPGPQLTFAEQAQCLDELRVVARPAEFVVASGSLPPGVPANYYQRVSEVCRNLAALFVWTARVAACSTSVQVYSCSKPVCENSGNVPKANWQRRPSKLRRRKT